MWPMGHLFSVLSDVHSETTEIVVIYYFGAVIVLVILAQVIKINNYK